MSTKIKSINLDSDLEIAGTFTANNLETTDLTFTSADTGITILGGIDGDKTWKWLSATSAWTSSEHINIADGKEYRIDGTSVLTSTTLGSGVINSSLASVGTLTSGTWNASTIAVNRGGTGQTSYTNGQLLIGNSTGNTLTKATLTAGANVTITNGAGSITIAANDTTYDVISEVEVTNAAHNTGRLITGQRLAYAFANITSANATTAAQTAQSVTFNNSGTGDSSDSSFNGSTARTISFNTIGAVPTTRTLTGANGIDTIGDLSANRTIQLTGQALALHNLATNGIIARTGAGNVAARTITAGADVSVTNGDGVSDNPIINNTSTLATVTGRGATTTSAITITDSTTATNTTTGALVVTGGIATADNIHVGGEVRDDHTHSRSTTTTINTTAMTNIDTFDVSVYRSGRYLIQINQETSYQMCEFRIIHDGTTTYFTEYAALETNGELGYFTADISGTDVRIHVAMNSATSATIKLNRTLITV